MISKVKSCSQPGLLIVFAGGAVSHSVFTDVFHHAGLYVRKSRTIRTTAIIPDPLGFHVLCRRSNERFAMTVLATL